MQNKYPIWHSLGHAILVFLYVSGVSWLMFNSQNLFGQVKDSFLDPLAVLLLFVLSATIVGTLVLGRPILLYWDGKKKEGLEFFGLTVLWMIIITTIVFIYLLAR